MYPNDSDANFCQACGAPQNSVPVFSPTPRHLNLASIDERFMEFRSAHEQRPYHRQKSQLEIHLTEFLSSLVPPRTVSSCTADDVIKFLISRDAGGRTIVHKASCSEPVSCSCPHRLAAGTVDSYLGKIRAIFNSLGRTDESNPVSHPRVKEYLKFVRHEQASLGIVPSQAVPLFFSKFKLLVSHLRGLITKGAGLSVANKYILARDVTFFVIDFFTGDRASDLGRLRSDHVFRLRDRQGFLLQFTVGKSQRSCRSFVVIPIATKEVCPVLWLDYYIAACTALGVDLSSGYLFRTCQSKVVVGDRPILGTSVANRLRKHLRDANLDEGENSHSFRRGLSNTLRQLGCSPEDIALYVGWSSSSMAEHYTRLSEPSRVLSLFSDLAQGLLSNDPPPNVSHPGNLHVLHQ